MPHMPFGRVDFKMAGVVALLGGMTLLFGCGMTPTPSNSSTVRELAWAHGGWSDRPGYRAYAESLLADVTPGLDASVRFVPRVRVLAAADPVAFAVAPREVLVSEGLLDWATPDEARAAISHELGHLVEAEAGVVASLLGEPGMGCPEARADRFAIRLLSRSGHDPAAMGSLLRRLSQHPSTGAAVKRHLAERFGQTDRR